MKLLVHGRSLASGASAERLRMAAGGLVLRGHEVMWRGSNPPFAAAEPPPGFEPVPRIRGHRADLALGGAPIPTAIAGWRSRADGMMVASGIESVGGRGAIERWCWESLHAVALVEADETASSGTGDELDTILPWSTAAIPDRPDSTHADVEILERGGERLLARRSGQLARPAVFLDRDGTLVVERGYLADPAGIELLPGAAHALRTLQRAGFALVVVSNQSGVGRGLYTLADVYATMGALRRALRGHGVEIDAIYFCPHRPDEDCGCRKPGTDLPRKAAQQLRLDLKHSIMVGDKRLDAAAAQRVGGRGVLVRTGYGREEERAGIDAEFPRAPDLVCDTLDQAAEWIIEARARSSPD